MSLIRTSLCVLLSIMMIVIPLSQSVAQETSIAGDYVAGRADGQKDGRGGGVWLFAGFFCGVFGILMAVVVEPTVKTDQLLGRSPEYARGYMDGYKQVAKKKNIVSAVNGCILAISISLVIYGILRVSAESSSK